VIAGDRVAGGRGAQAGAAVRRRPVIVAISQLDIAGIDRSTHANAPTIRPWFGIQGPLDLDPGPRGPARVREHGEGGVTLPLAPDQHATRAVHASADQRLVPFHDGTGDVGPLLPHPR